MGNKSGSQKTLLSFFSKSPNAKPQTPSRAAKPPKSTPNASLSSSHSDGSETLTTPPKSEHKHDLCERNLPSSPLRKRIIDDESDSDEDLPLKRTKQEELPSVPKSEPLSAPMSDVVPEIPSEAPASRSDATNGTSSTNLLRFNATSDHAAPPIKKRAAAPSINAPDGRYSWILNPKDADGNTPDDPKYDPRSIYIPPSAWAKFTAFEKQYWEIKGQLWDTIVFFKKGKFYELYERDALIAHSQFDLKLAGGGRANMQCAGIPEMSYSHWAQAFVSKGYKVAKVDQKETALAKEMRDETAGKKEEKIIRRELQSIHTVGTLTDETMIRTDMSQYCMAIKQDGTRFAIAFVDTATATFYFSDIDDDEDLHQFETLMAQTRPRELIIMKKNLSRYAEKILRNNSSVDTCWNIIKAGSEFWDSETATDELASSKYFGEEVYSDTSKYPAVLQEALPYGLLMSAFGALVWYLRFLKIDRQQISLGNFKWYRPVEKNGPLVIDGQTLQNLEIFANTYDQGTEGTLFRLVNKCLTPFGKRALKNWIERPLQNIPEIEARQDAVEMLMNYPQLREALEHKLSGLVDVERMLSRVHAGTLPAKSFARVVSALNDMNELKAFLLKQDISGLLIDLCKKVPDMDSLVEEWENAFDHHKAIDQNVLIPEPGVEPEFDETKSAINEIEMELSSHLKAYRKQFGSSSICYKDSGKEIYLIEMPASVKSIPNDWQQMAATKQVKRYWSPEVRQLVRQLQEAREIHKVACDKVQQKLYARFNTQYSTWLTVTHIVGDIDCLVSLARTSLNMPTHCRPEFKSSTRAHVKFSELVHPCNPNFIPNDIELGGPQSKLSLLTGANAAGKSTVLRSTGCAVILAQIGCHVPAKTASLTPIDRIMTRLGANDNIFAGKSTFHVELSETQRILTEASDRSLVVVDELGRGGSSSDGFAIAEAVLHHLATHIGALGFFATHYGTLYRSFESHPEVKPEHMEIHVDQATREVTFLYKLLRGQSDGSFGMNVAMMCGVQKSIVDAALVAADNYEHTQRLKKQGYQTMPIGLQSDVVWSLRNTMTPEAVRVMIEMCKSLQNV